ncbi:unnamed protein product, partial [marine sediment metagenome]
MASYFTYHDLIETIPFDVAALPPLLILQYG